MGLMAGCAAVPLTRQLRLLLRVAFATGHLGTHRMGLVTPGAVVSMRGAFRPEGGNRLLALVTGGTLTQRHLLLLVGDVAGRTVSVLRHARGRLQMNVLMTVPATLPRNVR